MPVPTERDLDDDAGRTSVRISDPGEIAAALPQLLGFRPRESVVMIGLTGPAGRRVGLCARVDIPPAEHAAVVARALAARVRTDRPRGVLVVVVSDQPGGSELPHRALAGEAVRALAEIGVAVPDVLLVREDRWWSYDCPHPCCHPRAGTPLPAGATELAAATVAAGTVVEDDRSALAARIAAPGRAQRRAMAEVCGRVAEQCTEDLLEVGGERVAAQSWTAVTAALARCRPGVTRRLDDGDVARIVWGLRDVDVRDRALELALGADAAAAEQLWTECTRRAPAPLDAAPATLLAVSAWLRGDGAMANVALGRALASEPGYRLALLLSEALDACLPPASLRELLRTAAQEPGRSFPVG
jgi:hypothetical protein